jgi:hypothetical protein
MCQMSVSGYFDRLPKGRDAATSRAAAALDVGDRTTDSVCNRPTDHLHALMLILFACAMLLGQDLIFRWEQDYIRAEGQLVGGES